MKSLWFKVLWGTNFQSGQYEDQQRIDKKTKHTEFRHRIFWYLQNKIHYNESTFDNGFFLEGFKETKERTK